MLKIQKTTDYSQFKILNQRNRAVLPKYLIESILKKNMLEEHPIICDANMSVIDGQHRLAAAEILQLPIYYIVSSHMNQGDIGICQIQKPWSMYDYLKFYSEIPDYKFVNDLLIRFSLPIHFLITCCNSSSNILKEFKQGNFIIKKNKQEIEEKLFRLKEIVKLFHEIKKNAGESELNISSRVQRSLWSLVNMEKYDHKRMIYSIKKYPSNVIPILNFNSETMIWKSLRDRVYNFKRSDRE